MVCFPAIAATAYFIAVILLDLYNRNWNQIPGHALFGVFAVLLILFICERASEFVAWILLAAPLVFVALGYIFSMWFSSPKSDTLPVDPPCNQCPCCSYRPCRCRRPCWRPKPRCPSCPDCPKPKPEPKPKPDNCIKPSLDE
jgi:hypothetical protein